MLKAEIIVDMQFGSTGKGAVAAFLVKNKDYDSSVRVQSIQAGHTIYYKDEPYKMRTIPCAWVNPNIKLVLGAGCFIEKELLLREIEMINGAMGGDVRKRLYIDYRAFYVLECDVEEEKNRALETGMGSTAHGAGASLVRKMWRQGLGRVADDNWAKENGLMVCDTIRLMRDDLVLVEGCQGTLLSIHTSPYYPFVTAREATAAGIIAEAGISPRDVTEVHGVFRTYPIRVGGNSGPTGSQEISWIQINQQCGREVDPERTTVTNRVRRIFEFCEEDFEHACLINKPTKLYMTFADYLAPGIYGATCEADIPEEAMVTINSFCCMVESIENSAPIVWIGTGERENHYLSSK